MKNKDLEALGVYDDPRVSYEIPEEKYDQDHIEKYGFDQSEWWDFDNTLARFIYTRLIDYQRNTITDLDSTLNTFEYCGKSYTMNQLINEILAGCKAYILCEEDDRESFEKYRQALHLLAETVFTLWD